MKFEHKLKQAERNESGINRCGSSCSLFWYSRFSVVKSYDIFCQLKYNLLLNLPWLSPNRRWIIINISLIAMLSSCIYDHGVYLTEVVFPPSQFYLVENDKQKLKFMTHTQSKHFKFWIFNKWKKYSSLFSTRSNYPLYLDWIYNRKTELVFQQNAFCHCRSIKSCWTQLNARKKTKNNRKKWRKMKCLYRFLYKHNSAHSLCVRWATQFIINSILDSDTN